MPPRSGAAVAHGEPRARPDDFALPPPLFPSTINWRRRIASPLASLDTRPPASEYADDSTPACPGSVAHPVRLSPGRRGGLRPPDRAGTASILRRVPHRRQEEGRLLDEHPGRPPRRGRVGQGGRPEEE